MKSPKFYRDFAYNRELLPNRYLAALEQGVGNIEQARQRTGLTLGYPGWNLIYYSLLAHLKPEGFNLIIETGTNIGCTTIMLAQALRDSGCQGRVLTVELERDNYDKAVKAFQDAGVSDLIGAVCGDSHAFLKALKNEGAPVRAALLDASHMFQDVMREFEAILPLLEPDAIVIFDNTYQIADSGEDQRVNGALKEILKRHGGNLINLPFVSWFTPGMAIWQKTPFPEDGQDGMKYPNEKEVEGSESNSTKQPPLTPPLLRRGGREVAGTESCPTRSADGKQALELWRSARNIFPHTTYSDLRRGLERIAEVESGMTGRHCGDLGDKLSQYLSAVEFFRATGADFADSIEIGTLFGGSCLMQLMARRDLGVGGRVVCIDPMQGFYGKDTDPLSRLPVTPEIFFGNLQKFGFSPDDVELRQHLSADPQAYQGLVRECFATLLIDGEHTKAGLERDWTIYHDCILPQGMILLDDYGEPAWPEITPAVDGIRLRLSSGWRDLGQFGTTYLIERAVSDGIVQRAEKRMVGVEA